jgi:hypothetical protein
MREPSLRTLTKRTPEGMKVCGHCCLEKPANDDHFDHDQSKPDGFRNWCKECRKKKADLKRLKNAADVIETLDKELLRNLAKSKNGGSNVPHIAQLCEAIVHILGGHQGVAQHWASNMIAAKPGSQTRERMLTGLLKQLAVLSDSNKVSMPAELMSDEDIDKELARRAERAQVFNVTPQESDVDPEAA